MIKPLSDIAKYDLQPEPPRFSSLRRLFGWAGTQERWTKTPVPSHVYGDMDSALAAIGLDSEKVAAALGRQGRGKALTSYFGGLACGFVIERDGKAFIFEMASSSYLIGVQFTQHVMGSPKQESRVIKLDQLKLCDRERTIDVDCNHIEGYDLPERLLAVVRGGKANMAQEYRRSRSDFDMEVGEIYPFVMGRLSALQP